VIQFKSKNKGEWIFMKSKHTSPLVITVPMLLMLLFLSACGGNTNTPASNAPAEILLGASIPKSGPLAGFGLYEEWGYTTAINEVNATGGLYLSQYHSKVPVRLITYDDESRSEQAAANVQRLIKQDKVTALLGSATPPLVIPGAMAAENAHVPMVTGIAPIRAFLAARPKWNYAWDIFFDELDMTKLQFQTMNMVRSNRKVALFTDTEQDGVVMGGLWEKNAPNYGYDIVYHAKFAVGTTNYKNFIQQAQAAQAQIVIGQMVTPDAIALWQQMQALNYRPASAFLEKGAEPVEWTSALHTSAQGVMVAGYWYPTLAYPGSRDLRQRFELDTGLTYSQHIADTYAAAQILMDAIVRAGTLNTEAVNDAIGKTNKTYVVGPVNFAKGVGGHTSTLASFMVQWQHGQTQIVYPPKLATAKLIYPLAPLN
jgi:branched-chain amino acid transport system substrate-binding protein